MEDMLQLFQDMPNLIPPKLQLLLTVLKTARDEVMWHLRHCVLPPHKDWPPKGFTEAQRLEWEQEFIPDIGPGPPGVVTRPQRFPQ